MPHKRLISLQIPEDVSLFKMKAKNTSYRYDMQKVAFDSGRIHIHTASPTLNYSLYVNYDKDSTYNYTNRCKMLEAISSDIKTCVKHILLSTNDSMLKGEQDLFSPKK